MCCIVVAKHIAWDCHCLPLGPAPGRSSREGLRDCQVMEEVIDRGDGRDGAEKVTCR